MYAKLVLRRFLNWISLPAIFVFVFAFICGGLFFGATTPARAGDLRGSVSAEFRVFPYSPLFDIQKRHNASLSFQPEYYLEWQDRKQSLLIVPFVRLDSSDPERTHFDIRELLWQRVGNGWELRAGIGKVFWGVTESQHLVDVINQTDFIENIDGEDKLGQPMVNLAVIRNWGTINFFVLPGFRKRTFPGEKARLRFPVRVDTVQAQFESSAEERHVDFAARWFHTLGDWEVGFSHFYGTSRDPLLLPGTDAGGAPVLIPRYDLINQTALDLQMTRSGWLWKLEVISRGGQGARFTALTGGFEYTFYNVRSTGLDWGLLTEYLYDSRNNLSATPFEDDIFLATRFSLNDVQSTDLLAGVIFDRENGASMLNIEAARRLGGNWRLTLEVRSFVGTPPVDPLAAFSRDDHVQLELARHF